MKYILTAGWEDGIADLTERLAKELASGKKVLWLLSGGSNISASVQVMENISEELTQKLTVMLGDERYGKVGHPDSNWQQLLDAGFQAGRAKLLPILIKDRDFQATQEHFESIINQAFSDNEVIIAQIGIGPDGHLAGILPDTAAASEQNKMVAAYHTEPFDRLTLTFPALRQVTAAYAFAFGGTKKEALSQLQSKALPLNQQPAQILKEIDEVYLYSDQVTESA